MRQTGEERRNALKAKEIRENEERTEPSNEIILKKIKKKSTIQSP